MEKTCKTCSFHLTGKCSDCCWPNRAGDAPSKWQPKEGTMKYKVLKEISLLTLAQAGPKGCGEFRGEWHSLAIHMSKKGYTHEWTIPAGCTDGAVDDLIQWINDKPMRGKFGIEKGFIEKVEPDERPCIWCGGKCIMKFSGSKYYVRCTQFCECNASGPRRATPQEAREAWDECR